jgi:hypothetical protein
MADLNQSALNVVAGSQLQAPAVAKNSLIALQANVIANPTTVKVVGLNLAVGQVQTLNKSLYKAELDSMPQ